MNIFKLEMRMMNRAKIEAFRRDCDAMGIIELAEECGDAEIDAAVREEQIFENLEHFSMRMEGYRHA